MTTLAQSNTDNKAFSPFWALVLGIMAASLAAPFIRLTSESGVPAPLVAAGRLLLAAIILSPIVWAKYRHELRSLSRTDYFYALGAGFWVTVHFILLITALEHTSVMLNQVLVNTSPIWAAVLESLFLRVKLSRMVWLGIGIAFIGGMFIAINSVQTVTVGTNPLLGTVLAILGAIAGTLYMLFGRKVRSKISLVPYNWLAFSFGGILALGYALLMGYSFSGLGVDAYFWLIMLTLIPQLVGHSGFNYALAFMNATFVTLVTQIVTVTAAIVAFFIFGEIPTLAEAIGAGIIILGVIVAVNAPQEKN